MKKIITLLVLLILLLIPINILGENKRLVDDVDVLTDEQENNINTILDALADKYDFDVVVYLSNDLSFGDDITSEGCEFYDLNGYGYGDNHRGVLLIVNYETGLFDIITTGDEVRNKYDGYIEDCFNAIQSSLRNNPYDSIMIFGYWVDTRFIDENVVSGSDVINRSEQEDNVSAQINNTPRNLIVSGVVSALICLITGIVLKKQLKTEGKKHGAMNYIDKNSFNLTRSGDIFLYRSTTRRRIKNDSNNSHNSGGKGFHVSHTSSRGISHGSGGGRRF